MKIKIVLVSIILIIGVTSCSNNKYADPDFKYDRIQAAQINNTGTANEIAQITLPATIYKAVNNSAAPVVIQQPSPDISASSNSNINAANITLNPAHGKAEHRCEIAVGAPLNSKPGNALQNQASILPAVAKLNSGSTNKSLNPAHGQPGHRCDIAVGAPLNSKPGNALQNQASVIPAVARLNSGSTNKSLNPAHGQPGHRCDIAVGAPLNSKPASAGVQNKQTIVNSNSKEAASLWGAAVKGNSVVQNQAGKTITTPGMNPSHGEPGHRCDIPVGTSLDQPMVKTDNPIKNTKSNPSIKDSAKN